MLVNSHFSVHNFISLSLSIIIFSDSQLTALTGIILLTLLFAFPVKIFWQNLSNENELIAMYSYCGILLMVSFAIFGQTQSMFTSHAAVIFFIFFLFLFIAQISRLSNTDDNHDSTS